MLVSEISTRKNTSPVSGMNAPNSSSRGLTHRNIGLRLGKVIDAHRILHTHNRRFPEPGNKKASETIHTAHMAAAGTRHLDNFSANQFEALVRWKDAGIQDALKLVPREELLGDRLRGHTQMILSLPGHVILRVRVNCI